MAALLLCLGIDPPMLLGKNPLPAPIDRGAGILSVKGIWSVGPGPLAVPDEDFVAGEIDLLDAQTQTLHEP